MKISTYLKKLVYKLLFLVIDYEKWLSKKVLLIARCNSYMKKPDFILMPVKKITSLNKYARTLTINITNKAEQKKEVILFESLSDKKDDPDIEIKLAESNYHALLRDLLSTTYIISFVRLNCGHHNTYAQLSNGICIARTKVTGLVESNIIVPLEYAFPKAFLPIIDIDEFLFPISKDTSWIFEMNPRESVTISFSIFAKIEPHKIEINNA